MARRASPSYRLHKATGQAVVTLNGRDFYLGPYGTAASKKYRRLIAEWKANNGQLRPSRRDATVVELLAAFFLDAKTYHSRQEQDHFALAARPLKQLYGRTRVKKFTTLALKAVRQAMIEAGLSRNTINARIRRLRAIFKWGVENDVVPVYVWYKLRAVAGLQY